MGVAGEPMPFGEWALKYLPEYFTNKPSRFHDWLVGELNDLHRRKSGPKKINVLAPRGAAKSTWISIAYPLYCAVYRLEPYIVLTSDTGAQASKYLDSIRHELETNERLKQDFPHATGKGRVWRQDAIVLRNGVRIESLGTGTKLRGRKHGQHRPTLIVVDDPQNSGHILSELQRERSWDWLTKDVLNAGGPVTNYLVAGTALHVDCIVCALHGMSDNEKFQSAGWDSHLFASIEQWPDRMDLWAKWQSILQSWDNPDRQAAARRFYDRHEATMDKGAIVLWPERETIYTLMLKRAEIGENAFNYERQNNPVNPEACEWAPEIFTHGAFWFDEWPDNLVFKVVFLDPSKGASDKQGDYSAFILYGRDSRGVEYVEGDLKRRPVDQIVADGIEHVRRFHPDAFGVEANAFQELLAPLFRQAARAQRVELPLYLFNHSTNKQVRIRRLTEPLVQRKMRFKRTAGTHTLVKQLREFPNSAHDDGPDALEAARRLGMKMNDQRRGRR